ncbi:hypothetical protein COEREDRAFT_86268 [Coemansia reversa NRRL 1564]|uniref:PHD-type domain-containing protein n=1 Tax=Coemansia reversa (strain ATCC 12441 / NRRL 1564) TaxID=763665 RepID=A0A2G5BE22_COERN|nr:hypothetical protein COEREDRAFT_86268 [Coemansia reversa NRRL 1564]|eukprot:PIA17269.1 hypothetical protein COEREDRAFT_86268 [Coemansia reversa NRRL 1564]
MSGPDRCHGADGPLSPLAAAFDYDSSGSLSSLDSFLDALSDCADDPLRPDSSLLPERQFNRSASATDAKSSQTVPLKQQEHKKEKQNLPSRNKRERTADVSSPKPRQTVNLQRQSMQTLVSSNNMITTGAFLTRTTLRKLGVADIVADPEASNAGLAVGSRIKVLNLDKHWYTAVVLAIDSGKALAHYPGWEHCYNEWVLIESRRLLYRGKADLGVSGSTKAMEQLEALYSGVEEPVLIGFDLAQAINDAFGISTGCNLKNGGADEAAANVFVNSVDNIDSGTLARKQSGVKESKEHRSRGRPAGTRNRRRAGHIKAKSSRKQRPTIQNDKAKKTLVGDQEESAAAECPSTPGVPAELRVPSVRLVRAAENPYARCHRSEDIFCGDSDENEATARESCLTAVRDVHNGGNEEPSGKKARIADDNDTATASSGNAIWHLTRGDYVTTGAFSTRRTIKALAHSGSTGGIMQDHHGYYPGQRVEIMNANQSWYQGRVIAYANKKFLIHYGGWDHANNEWIVAGSRRMRPASDINDMAVTETEEMARKACVVLVDEYNTYIDGVERKNAEKADAKRKARELRKTPVNVRVAKLAQSMSADSMGDDEAEEMTHACLPENEEEDDEDVDPISVEAGYTPVPQLLRVKDYVQLFRKGMQIAARDRNKLWWRATIAEIKTFRLRIHYTGFGSSWDEWVEMNTQRIMFEESAESSRCDAEMAGDPLHVSGENSSALSKEPNCMGQVISSSSHGKDAGQTDYGTVEESQETKGIPVPRRLGRPPGPETKSTPLSLRLALKALMSDREMFEQCHPEELDVFHLPKEHMSMRDYSTFLKVGDRVRIRDRDKQWYDCTIIDLRHGRIRICFNGHSDEFNQWIPVNSDRIRILRETIDGDKRLEKMEKESQIAQRRKQEKLRAQRRKRSQASIASLVRLAESLEYIVDCEDTFVSGHTQVGPQDGITELDAATEVQSRLEGSTEDDASGGDDKPLLQLMMESDIDNVDGMPLLTRILLAEHFKRQRFGALIRHGSMVAMQDSATWFVYCNQCNIVISTFRYYCLSCERPSDGYDYESYDLCLMCFSRQFPSDHPHSQASFARAAVGDAESIVKFTADALSRCRDHERLAAASAHMLDLFSGLIAVYEPDAFDTSYKPRTPGTSLWSKLAVGLHGTTTSTLDTSAVVGKIIGNTRRSRITSIINPDSEMLSSCNGHDADASSDKEDKDETDRQLCKADVDDLPPRCAFCSEDDQSQRDLLGTFAAEQPFVLSMVRDDGTVRRRRFWAHTACAKYSPEVLVTEAGQWFNVAAALRRARTIKCAECKRRGATIGCFHDRCQKSFHVACAGMSKSFFESGRIFWCPKHARMAAGVVEGNAGPEPVSLEARCANCNHELSGDLMWMECLECLAEPERQFSLCLTCYDSKDALADHPHKKRCFREHLSHTGGVSSNGQYLADIAAQDSRRRVGKGTTCCHYCRSRQSRRWRKGYAGVVMCEACFNTAHSLRGGAQAKQVQAGTVCDQDLFAEADNDSPGELEVVALNPFGRSLITGSDAQPLPPPQQQQQGALIEDYTQGIYFTREACIAPNRVGLPSVSQQPLGELSSYGPTDSMLFTLPVNTSYFDIPGRAPRWASHSGTDYHGTWLPQTVRRALLRYTQRGEHVLSNFLGRGTDAIECFLLNRKCVGVDINPSAVSLSQRNCSFTITPGCGMSIEFRPTIMQGDARDLRSDLWPGASYFAESESFDHILSHPPYKDCVLYSTNIDGDLSRFPGPDEFQREMEKVVTESWRLLKMGRHLTLGIGDNRAECFYIPVSYQLIRTYISSGFELEELVVKRQRYCQAFGLGTYLCVQFDFLMFTHEFIATLRKVPKDQIDSMHLADRHYAEDSEFGLQTVTVDKDPLDFRLVAISHRCLREVPASPIERKGVVMGSVWTFEHHPVHSFTHMCMSRMVERFGRDGSNWEQIDLALRPLEQGTTENAADGTNAASDIAAASDTQCTGDVIDDKCASLNNARNQAESDPELLDSDTEEGGYERARQRQIQQNREQLLQLGLVSELGEDSTDIAHYQKMIAMTPLPPTSSAPLALIVVPHILNTEFARCHVEPYRRTLVQITHDASHRLCPSGLLVLGVQDVRDEHGKLWPLGMLVLEDVQRAVGSIRLRLKEFIVVVENGYARKRDDVMSRETFVDEQCVVEVNTPDIHVPIVHAYYLVFMKLK